MKEAPLLLPELHSIPAHVTYTWLAMAILIGLALVARYSLKRTAPTGIQNFFEVIVGGLENFVVNNMGPEGRPFLTLLGSLFLFILVCNLMGLVPGFESPTSNLNTTLALALISFTVTHAVGVKRHGFAYVKHFLGPIWWLTPLMLPIEVISHFARIISLSFRLFGNMQAKHLLLLVLFFLSPLGLGLQVPILALGLLVSVVQAGVFMLLTTLYIAGSMEEAHMGGDH
jgi:F-type H+-transporting ATPase subunit a